MNKVSKPSEEEGCLSEREKRLACALLDILDSIGALSRPYKLIGHGMSLDRSEEMVAIANEVKERSGW